ncbi:hypothetical protein XENTR_v10011065 [Xenopus tropicalis]|uniref:Cell cycle exit and neuronal differentiation protein 1 n=1 Tax=Xenopus tropicalis TaxID=8364 RepID=A0A6I8R7I4_XENTR|nr:hypothetical protein XENTR_v10011065 [Xenopus tropicalis]
MEAKSRSTSSKASKTEKGGSAAAEKKDTSTKEQHNPSAKKMTAESIPANQDGTKPVAAEPQVPPAASEDKGNAEEQDTSNGTGEGSGFEGLKPLLVAAGVTVAALAVIVGVVFLARKK